MTKILFESTKKDLYIEKLYLVLEKVINNFYGYRCQICSGLPPGNISPPKQRNDDCQYATHFFNSFSFYSQMGWNM